MVRVYLSYKVMGGNKSKPNGFTIAEILIVVVVIAILAAISAVTYRGLRARATRAVVYHDLESVGKQLSILHVTRPDTFNELTGLPDTFERSEGVTITYNPLSGNKYTGLTPVQNGVLFYNTCTELIEDPQYSVINSKDGKNTQSVVMRCDDNIRAGGILITGWDSKNWDTPLDAATLEDYIDSVPYDDWWTDKQDVVRSFYRELIDRFQRWGGTFPVTSFWDPWANQWAGVPKEELPVLNPVRNADGSFCIEAYHEDYPDDVYRVTQDGKIEPGHC